MDSDESKSKFWNAEVYLIDDPGSHRLLVYGLRDNYMNFPEIAIRYEDTVDGRLFTKISFHCSKGRYPSDNRNIQDFKTSETHPNYFNDLALLLADRIAHRECRFTVGTTLSQIKEVFSGEVMETMLRIRHEDMENQLELEAERRLGINRRS